MKKFLLYTLLLLGFFGQANARKISIPSWDYYYDLKAHEKGQIHFFYGFGQPRLDYKLFDYHKNEADFRNFTPIFTHLALLLECENFSRKAKSGK